jgi:hypothetical protein
MRKNQVCIIITLFFLVFFNDIHAASPKYVKNYEALKVEFFLRFYSSTTFESTNSKDKIIVIGIFGNVPEDYVDIYKKFNNKSYPKVNKTVQVKLNPTIEESKDLDIIYITENSLVNDYINFNKEALTVTNKNDKNKTNAIVEFYIYRNKLFFDINHYDHAKARNIIFNSKIIEFSSRRRGGR